MKIKVFTNSELNQAHAYLVINEMLNEAILIDLALLNKEINAYLRTHKLKLTNVLLTHGHYDHAQGLDWLLEENPTVIAWIHQKDYALLHSSWKNFSFKNKQETWEMDYHPRVKTFIEDVSLTFSGIKFNLTWRPSHTHGTAVYEIPDQKFLFSGDVVFKKGEKIVYGRHYWYQLQTNPRGFKEQLKTWKTSYQNWVFYPGHYETEWLGKAVLNKNKAS